MATRKRRNAEQVVRKLLAQFVAEFRAIELALVSQAAIGHRAMGCAERECAPRMGFAAEPHVGTSLPGTMLIGLHDRPDALASSPASKHVQGLIDVSGVPTRAGLVDLLH